MIRCLEPVMGAHRLVFSPKAIKQEETQRQITRLYNERGALSHDDRVDALAATVQYFEDSLGIDVDKAIESAKMAREDEMWKMMINDDKRGIAILGERASGAVRLRDDHFSRSMNRAAQQGFNGRVRRRMGR